MVTEHERAHEGAHGMEHGVKFDQEISRRWVMATGVGILVLTIVSMLLMWWMSAELMESAQSQGPPLTEVQQMRQQRIEAENELQSQVEYRAFPALEWPRDVSVPGGLVFDDRPYPPDRDVPAVPLVQVAPWLDMQGFLDDQRSIQESLGWDDPNGRLAHIPLDEAVEKVLAAPREAAPDAASNTEPSTEDEP